MGTALRVPVGGIVRESTVRMNEQPWQTELSWHAQLARQAGTLSSEVMAGLSGLAGLAGSAGPAGPASPAASAGLAAQQARLAWQAQLTQPAQLAG